MVAKITLVVALLVGVASATSNSSIDVIKPLDAPAMDKTEEETPDEDEVAAPALPAKFLASKPSAEEPSPKKTDGDAMAAMESAMTNLMLGKTAFGATPMGGSVKQIEDVLTKTMMPKVVAAHKADQNTVDVFARRLAKCGSTKKISLRAAAPSKRTYGRNSVSHKRCRASQAVQDSSVSACMSKQRALYTEKGLKCKFFSTLSGRFGNQKDNNGIVKKAGGEATLIYITRISATVCGRHGQGSTGRNNIKGGWGGGLPGGMLDQYLKAKEDCEKAKRAYESHKKACKAKHDAFMRKRSQCNQYQLLMDSSSCKNAVMVKDACEAYGGCYATMLAAFNSAWKKGSLDAADRKAEWRGLKRMACLIKAFADGKVTGPEVDACKKITVDTKQFDLKKPAVAPKKKCVLPNLYPSTGAYKIANFRPLPALAKGFAPAACSGMVSVSTTPMKGSPKGAKCERVSLNGPYSAGALVKCTGGHDTRRSYDKNSCPVGTKIWSPASRGDWKTFLASSAAALRKPHFIVDVTRPQNSCGGCTRAMNSKNKNQAESGWRTSDGSAWWLRSTRLSEPNGDYHANCYLGLGSVKSSNGITFNDGNCNYHSKDYYCQPIRLGLKPNTGSPKSCRCSKVDLTGSYSAGYLVKCSECLTVSRAQQKNSCPKGMKIFAPQSRQDWKVFLDSAGPLRAPHWIIDVTRPQNGCGGCTKSPMMSANPRQATWKTSDGSPWWLRSTVHSQPSGDYKANCYMDLWRTPTSSNTIQFNDYNCNYKSRSYYCQPKKNAKNYAAKPPVPVKPPPPPPSSRVPIGKVVAFHGAYGNFMRMAYKKIVKRFRPDKHTYYGDSSGSKAANALPTGWSWERFQCVDAGKGEIAIHSKAHNRFMRMDNKQKINTAGAKNVNQLPGNWGWERFKVVDAAGGQVAFHSKSHNRFIKMYKGSAKRMGASPKKNANQLPSSWGAERFTVVDADGYLKRMPVGKVVALHNKAHNRFMRMHKNGKMDTSNPKNFDKLPSPKQWGWERFSVVDAGKGDIALHQANHNKFVRMSSKDMDTADKKDKNKLPSNWMWERFRIVDAGNNQIALHNQAHRRFVRMNNNGGAHKDMDRSGKKNNDQLPSNWGWERFTVHVD